MEQELLTAKDLMLYNKAKVICYNEKIQYDIHFIDLRNERVYLRTNVFDPGDNRDDISVEDCKLVLREFSNGFTFDEQTKFLSFCKNQIKEIKGDMFWKLTFQQVIKHIKKSKIVECINYLRSIRINVDYTPDNKKFIYDWKVVENNG